jgi:hypothetical protein
MKTKRSFPPFHKLAGPSRAAAVVLLAATALLPAGAQAQTTYQYLVSAARRGRRARTGTSRSRPERRRDSTCIFRQSSHY